MQNERTEIERVSCDMLTRYYENNDTSLYFENMDDKIIWIGPGRGQYMEGKRKLLAAFAKENNTLRFRLSNITSRAVYVSKQSYEVLLRYEVDSLYPSGVVTHHFQRSTILWRKKTVNKKKVWRFVLTHISNEEIMDARDGIYPIHHDELTQSQATAFFQRAEQRDMERLMAKGMDDAIHFIPCADIVYIQSGKGKCSTIHTTHGELTVRLMIGQLIERLPDYFCRVHAAYIVNTDELDSIRNYTVRLKNGLTIPVPAKRYRAVLEEVKACVARRGAKE